MQIINNEENMALEITVYFPETMGGDVFGVITLNKGGIFTIPDCVTKVTFRKIPIAGVARRVI